MQVRRLQACAPTTANSRKVILPSGAGHIDMTVSGQIQRLTVVTRSRQRTAFYWAERPTRATRRA